MNKNNMIFANFGQLAAANLFDIHFKNVSIDPIRVSGIGPSFNQGTPYIRSNWIPRE